MVGEQNRYVLIELQIFDHFLLYSVPNFHVRCFTYLIQHTHPRR